MKKYKNFIYYLSILFTGLYLIYRILFTLPKVNTISFFFALIVFIIEIIDAFFFCIYVFNILVWKWKIPNKPKLLKKNYPDIDVFIATVNEDVILVEETVKACLNMKYPNQKKIHIYLCDDGCRNSMRKLCQKYKIHYITRKDHEHAKAGNYNHALEKTKSPYVAVFDADMRPTTDFLMDTVPYLFLKEKIGFVQLPQCFSNPDIYQNKYKLWNHIPMEQDYFYHRIQVSRNHHNSVIFCGTNAILSREALNDIGGFATETITEDFATGLMMEGHGFLGIALPYDDVYGSNVEDISSFMKQRSRWCRGCIQTYQRYKILTNKGLSVRQKLDYLSGIYYWFFGIRNILYLLIPLLYTFFDIPIIQGNFIFFSILFFIQYFLKRYVIDFLENRKVSSTWNRIYEVVLSPLLFFDTIFEIIGFHKKQFEVTLKNKQLKNTYQYYFVVISHIFLFILNLMGFYVSYQKGYLYGFLSFLIPLFWLGSNCIYLLFALIFDFSQSTFDSHEIHSSYQYSFLSFYWILKNFIVEEIHIKRFVAGIGIIIVSIIGFYTYQYYQYQKSIIIPSDSLVSYHGNLKIQDGNIVNDNGEVVSLRGMSSHNLNWYGRIYTKDNLREIRDTWGVNCFRLAVYTNPNEDGYIKHKEQIHEIEKIIDYCIDLDIYVIVDWHILIDNNPNTYKEDAIEFFDKISLKYRNVPNVIYEICNEPNGDDVTWNDDIKPYAEEIIRVIRNHSKNSLIIVGLADWCKDIESAKNNLLEDPNILYAVHFYAGDPDIIHLKDDIKKAKDIKMPLIVTECGATNESGDGVLYQKEFKEWIQYLEKNHISWIVWQLSEKDEASSLIIKKEVQDRLDYLYERYTERQLQRKKYHINDYLSDTGKFMKKIFIHSINEKI